MTDKELNEIEARANAATPGRWKKFNMRRHQIISEDEYIGEIEDYENANFITYAREDVPALIAEVRQARAERDVLIDIQLSHGSCPYTEKHECQKDQHLNDDDIKECWLKWVKNHIIKEVENG